MRAADTGAQPQAVAFLRQKGSAHRSGEGEAVLRLGFGVRRRPEHPALGAVAGNLTSSIHAAEGEDTPALRALIEWSVRNTGRLVFGGWPTGVAVSHATQHGGPWPATTNDAGTSVGSAAIDRFLRAVAYQDVPASLLPEPLRDDNPWNVPQRRSPAGTSQSWGRARG